MKHLPLLLFYLLLGFNFQFPSVAMRYWMMEDVKVSPAQMAAIFGVVAIPWCMKPIYGFISDSYPLFGLRRRPYMIIMSYVSCFMWILLPFVPHDEFLITLVMTISSAGLCFVDVMADSLLVVAARDEPEKDKGTIQSWAWIMRFIGGLIASGLGALAYDWLGSVRVFLLNAMVPIAIAVVSNFIPDSAMCEHTDWRDTSSRLWSAVKKPIIYKPALFLFILTVTPGYGSVMTYFYERKLGFTPNEFGMLDVLGYVVSIVGTLIYKRWLREVSFPKIFFWALLLSFVLENTLLLLVFHTNRVIGIPDFVFALIERIVLTLVGQFISMPMVVLGARVCPVGVEGTLYALLMSITNFGDVVSSEWGSMFTSMFGVSSTNFANLWKLMLLCHAFDIVPLLCIGLVKNIKPNRSQTADPT